jgi:Glycosyltransferase
MEESMNKHLDICFLGGIYPKEYEEEVIKNSKTGIANAANNLQWKYIRGFDSISSNPIKIINSMYIGSFPKYYKKIMIHTQEFSHKKNATDINVGFLNIYGIKNYFRYLKLKPYLKKWSEEDKEQEKIIFAYAMTYTFLKSLRYVKKCNLNVKTCLIVPDLPEYMNTTNKQSLLYKFLKTIEIMKIKKNMKYVDKFILLTEQMAEKLNIEQDRYIVIEGMVDFENENTEENLNNTNKPYIFKDEYTYLCYTGTLNEKYGIKTLVKAMDFLSDKKIKLVICGRGDSERFIKEKNNGNIDYLGNLSYKDTMYILKNSDFLINPRSNEEEYTKYSFPSKTMDYLISGTPTLMFKLDGIPNKYDQFLNYFTFNNAEQMAQDINSLLERYEACLDKATKGKKYILEKKNNYFLCDKILKTICCEYKREDRI